jgi:hypothetical protein
MAFLDVEMQLNAAPGKALIQQMEKAGAWPKFHSQLLWRAKVSAKFGRSGVLSGEITSASTRSP